MKEGQTEGLQEIMTLEFRILLYKLESKYVASISKRNGGANE